MAINSGLASLSEGLWTGATATYVLAVVAYTGEYAFGKSGRIAQTAAANSVVREPAMVGAAGVSGSGNGSFGYGTEAPATPTFTIPASNQRDAGRRWGLAAITLTVIGLLLHIACVVIRGAAVDRVPWGNMYEFTLVVGMIATIAWLGVLWRMPSLRYLGLFVMLPVVVVMFLAGTLYTKASKLVPALQSYWLAIHVSSVAVAEGILLTSAAMTGMYLIRSRYERIAAAAQAGMPAPRYFSTLGANFPASASLDKAAYRTVAFAFPIYTAGVIFGAIWAEAAWGRYWGWDPKETWAFIAWVIYATYLHARATAGWKGSRAATINLLGFAAMTFNFFVVNIVISGLHSYAGLN